MMAMGTHRGEALLPGAGKESSLKRGGVASLGHLGLLEILGDE